MNRLDERTRVALKKCTLTHGVEGNDSTVYGHHGSVRICIRLYGTDDWVYDPGWELARELPK